MAYFKDLSDYRYHSHFYREGTKNIGWLEKGYDFQKEVPDSALLDALWKLCAISVAQMRGIHECDLCAPPEWIIAKRDNQRLSLGSSEVRVLSAQGQIYAAPNLIYHYVCDHHYKPPGEFVQALVVGPLPPSPAYFQMLENLSLEWSNTSDGQGRDKKRFRLRSP